MMCTLRVSVIYRPFSWGDSAANNAVKYCHNSVSKHEYGPDTQDDSHIVLLSLLILAGGYHCTYA